MNIDAYLNRIDYKGDLTPGLSTLAALHRAHLRAIPYENLDIHLDRVNSLDQHEIFAKLVLGRRGGWCYEMNGLFAWALECLGFNVTRLASTVGRQSADTEDGAHLILLVHLDRDYLADVGFGRGLLEPIPLEAGIHTRGFLTYDLTCNDSRWVLTCPITCGPSVDFTLRARSFSDFGDHCTRLQTSPDHWFTTTTVCHRVRPKSIISLTGLVFRTLSASGVKERIIKTRRSYRRALCEDFDLKLSESEVSHLWEKAWQRHLVWKEGGSHTPEH